MAEQPIVKPASDIGWCETGSHVASDTTSSHKADGFAAPSGSPSVGEAPSSQELNYLFREYAKHIEYLESIAIRSYQTVAEGIAATDPGATFKVWCGVGASPVYWFGYNNGSRSVWLDQAPLEMCTDGLRLYYVDDGEINAVSVEDVGGTILFTEPLPGNVKTHTGRGMRTDGRVVSVILAHGVSTPGLAALDPETGEVLFDSTDNVAVDVHYPELFGTSPAVLYNQGADFFIQREAGLVGGAAVFTLPQNASTDPIPLAITANAGAWYVVAAKHISGTQKDIVVYKITRNGYTITEVYDTGINYNPGSVGAPNCDACAFGNVITVVVRDASQGVVKMFAPDGTDSNYPDLTLAPSTLGNALVMQADDRYIYILSHTTISVIHRWEDSGNAPRGVFSATTQAATGMCIDGTYLFYVNGAGTLFAGGTGRQPGMWQRCAGTVGAASTEYLRCLAQPLAMPR